MLNFMQPKKLAKKKYSKDKQEFKLKNFSKMTDYDDKAKVKANSIVNKIKFD